MSYVIDLSESKLSEIDEFSYNGKLWKKTRDCDDAVELNVRVKHGKGTRVVKICASEVEEETPEVEERPITDLLEESENIIRDKQEIKKYFIETLRSSVEADKSDKLESEKRIAYLDKIYDELIKKYKKDMKAKQTVLDEYSTLTDLERNRTKAKTKYTKEQILDEIRFNSGDLDRRMSNFPIENISCNDDLNIPSYMPELQSLREKNRDSRWLFIEEQIGDASTVGKVYLVCKNNKIDCNYIVKIMDINRGSPQLDQGLTLNLQLVTNEILMNIRASELGVAPRIIDAFYCRSFMTDYLTGKKLKAESNEHFFLCKKEKEDCFIFNRRVYIIMEKMDITVNTFLLHFKSRNYEKLFPIYLSKLRTLAERIVNFLFTKNIRHKDEHASNFMFNLTDRAKDVLLKIENLEISPEELIKIDKNLDFFGSFESLKIIDFGKAVETARGADSSDLLYKLYDAFSSENIY